MESYTEKLLLQLHERHPEFLCLIDRVILPHRSIILRKSRFERGIFLFSRVRHRPIISEWAVYILTTAQAIVHGLLPDFRKFELNRIARAYIFQLSIMFNSISGCWSHSLYDAAQIIAPLTSPVWSGSQDLSQKMLPASKQELDALAKFVIPQMNAIADWLSPSTRDQIITVNIQDFHSQEMLEGIFDRQKFNELAGRIVSAYEKYPAVTERLNNGNT